MQRDIMTSLEKCGASTRHKSLILKGARQVGKTWVLKEFGAKRSGPRETVRGEVVAARKDEHLNASGHCSEYANAQCKKRRQPYELGVLLAELLHQSLSRAHGLYAKRVPQALLPRERDGRNVMAFPVPLPWRVIG